MVDNLPSVRLPAGPLTKHGAYHVLKGDKPLMWLKSGDGTALINLMGGTNMPDPTCPESVQMKELKALGASWKVIKQKGATQDGETFIDALYDAAEPTMKVVARGRDATHTRAVRQLLEASVDAKQQSELNFFTPELGRWWADIRLLKAIPDPMSNTTTSQEISLMLGIDDAFWRSEPNTDSFEFEYTAMTDTFDTAYDDGAGPNWPVYYYDGDEGNGHVRSNGDQLVWVDTGTVFLTEGLSVVLGPYKDFETDTNNQVVSIVLGTFQELDLFDEAQNHIWARMGRDGSGNWDGNGVRVSIGPFSVELTRFNDFVPTRMGLWPNLPSLPGEKYTLVAGFEGNERQFQVQRNGLGLWNHVEAADGLSPLGPDYRGVGPGMRAGGALITQATPAGVRKISAGDNASVSQSGYLERVNVGDQKMYDEITIFGPADEVKIWNGPGADVGEYISIKNILPNQVFFLRTDPRKRIIQDLTSVAPTPQELNVFQQAADAFFDFAMAKGALKDQVESAFGILPPQGIIDTLVTGRFSDDYAIPPKPAGKPAETYHIKVSIDGGNAASQIIASGIPLRRSPI